MDEIKELLGNYVLERLRLTERCFKRSGDVDSADVATMQRTFLAISGSEHVFVSL
jgi:hypothetical protein